MTVGSAKKQKIKPGKGWVSRSGFVFTGLLTAGLMSFSSLLAVNNSVYAAGFDTAAKPDQYLSGRVVATALECLYLETSNSGGPDIVRRKISLQDANSGNIFENLKGDPADNVLIGFDLKNTINDDDGEIDCEEIEGGLSAAVKKVFGSDTALPFIELFYTKDGDDYKLNSDDAGGVALDLLKNSAFIKSLSTGDAAKIRQSIAFAQCFDEAEDGATVASSNTPELSNPYYFLDGKDDNDEIYVGVGNLGGGTGTGGGDEKYQCTTLRDLAKTADLIGFMESHDVTTGVLRNNPQHLYQRVAIGEEIEESVDRVSEIRAEILAELDANPAIVEACLVGAGEAGDGIVTPPHNSAIADYLLGDEAELLTNDAVGSGLSKVEAEALKTCLRTVDGLGDLEAKLNEAAALGQAISELELESADLPTGGNVADQSDDCLANGDAFVGWFICPMINLIDSVLETVEDIIQSSLRFSLEDTSVEIRKADGTITTQKVSGNNSTGELRDTWNVFRGLSTILVVVGFLLALVMKGVKG